MRSAEQEASRTPDPVDEGHESAIRGTTCGAHAIGESSANDQRHQNRSEEEPKQ